MSLKHILQQGTLPGGWRVHGCLPDHPATLSWSSWAPRGERYRQHGTKMVRYYSSLKYIPSLGTASHRFSWMPQDWSGIVALSPCSVTPLPRIWDTDMQEDTTKPPVLSPGKTKPWVFHVAWYICSLSPWKSGREVPGVQPQHFWETSSVLWIDLGSIFCSFWGEPLTELPRNIPCLFYWEMHPRLEYRKQIWVKQLWLTCFFDTMKCSILKRSLMNFGAYGE